MNSQVTKIDSNLLWNFHMNLPSIEDNAKEILKNNPMYYDKFKIWRKWFDNRWVEVTEYQIVQFIKQITNASGLSHSKHRTTLLNALKDECTIIEPEIAPETWIQFKDNIYDISNDDIIIPNSEFYVKNIINIELADSIETPMLDKLFQEWLDDDYEILYDLISMAISPCYFLDIIFFLVGSGSNGKGVFTQILNDFIGAENITAQNIEVLSDPKQRFQTGDLYGKLLCNLGDGNFGVLKETKTLKELAGGKDLIKLELKNSNAKSYFYNTATLLGSFNTLPQSMDKTMGWYRRTHVTEFKKQFTGEKTIDTSQYRKEYPNLAFKCLNRLKEIYKTRNIKGWGTVYQRKEKYERLSDLIRQFMESQMVENRKGCFSGTMFYNKYRKWAYKNGRNELNFKECMTRLESTGIEKSRAWFYETDKGYRYKHLESIPDELKVHSEEKSDEFLLLTREQKVCFHGFFFKEQV